MSERCKVPIGAKGQKRPCDLPVRRDGLCNYHWIAADAKKSRKIAR